MNNVQSLGGFTLIHSNGNREFDVIINGIVSKEIQRLRKQDLMEIETLRKKLNDEMEWRNMANKNRSNLREDKLKLLNAKKCKTFKEKAIDKIVFVLACLIVWGKALKDSCIEYVGYDEEEWK